MANRSLNKVTLIGNMTRDPELRYTPSGTAVCTFGLATNRSWVTDAGEKKEEAEFHRLVAWAKLAEICGKFLSKGRKIYVEGRLQTRSWTGQDGAQRQSTEIVVDDMIILDSGRRVGEEGAFEAPEKAGLDVTKGPVNLPASETDAKKSPPVKQSDSKKTDSKKPFKSEDKKTKEKESTEVKTSEEEVPASDIPF